MWLQTDTMEVCSSASLLGQQLTLVELERLSFIGPEEFVQAFAKDSPHIDSSFKDMKKTKNLESYVHWFNRLSYLVASEICKVIARDCIIVLSVSSQSLLWSSFTYSRHRYRVSAFEKKAARQDHRILDRDCPRVFQRGQLQFTYGHHRRAKHVADKQAQKDGNKNDRHYIIGLAKTHARDLLKL